MRLTLRSKTFLILIVTAFFWIPTHTGSWTPDAHAAEKVKKVKPPKAKHRPNLSYRPNVSRAPVKYSGSVGILDMRDKRSMLFYGALDSYFSEPVLETLSKALYLEVKASRAFETVKNISGPAGQSLTRSEIKALAVQHNVDYIILADVTQFNLLREKMVKKKKGLDFKIKVRFRIFGQLIDAKSGAVLWAETIEREDGQLNTDKRVSAEDYGPSAKNAVQNGFDDMKISIREMGLEVKP